MGGLRWVVCCAGHRRLEGGVRTRLKLGVGSWRLKKWSILTLYLSESIGMIHVFLCHHIYNVSTDTTIAQGKTNETRSNSIPQLARNKIANRPIANALSSPCQLTVFDRFFDQYAAANWLGVRSPVRNVESYIFLSSAKWCSGGGDALITFNIPMQTFISPARSSNYPRCSWYPILSNTLCSGLVISAVPNLL